ncbi:MAG: 50S ribosomal protein L17 [Oscillospiraceae bacterium]|nr:50S ribosomal protein L17 [Oscillospiraceae bacterium]
MPANRKLGKATDVRMAMLSQQVTDLIEKGRIETTVDRAKEVRPLAEKMITLGKKNTLASRRQALAFMTREDAVTRMFTVLAPIYADRNGGYTRILRLGVRRGDAAEMALIELVDADKIAAADAEAEKAKQEAEKAAKKSRK